MIETLINKLENSRSVVVLTGAGISAASGVPTFRGKDGLWKQYRPDQLANYQAFKRDPELVWEWYLWRRNLIKGVQPNAAHFALRDLEKIIPEFTVITQNVDNLHQLSGVRNVIELHGNIMRSKCIDCGKTYEEDILLEQGIPRCPECDSYIRPDVVWFGESLPVDALRRSHKLASECEILLSIGTSGVVEPAASIPYIARDSGAFVAEINTDTTPLTPVADVFLQHSVEILLPEIVGQLRS
jgi:NAD-dependent deacetylase